MSDGMLRSLYLGFNRSYTNATAELTLRLLGTITQLDHFGPGFSTPEALRAGVEEWLARHGPYDFIVADSYVFEHDNVVRRANPFGGDFIRFAPEEFANFGPQYQDFFQRYPGTKLLIANWDTYGISDALIGRLTDSGALVIESGSSFHRPKQEIATIYGTAFALGNDNWFNFVTRHRARVVAIPHFVGASEFDFSPVHAREHLFTVIGAPYQERKTAMLVQTRKQRILDFLARLKLWLRQKVTSSMSELQLSELKCTYLSSISHAKFCYCSGGPWLCPVRKYFEIPARGAIAIGWPCTGFAALGFVDRKNFLVATSNADIKAALSSYTPDELQQIADAGRALIWNRHSDWARASQLRESLELIRAGKFKGSYWSEGAYLHFQD
jgi:hypothetical protein